MKTDKIYITETPRDALQGWKRIIPTQEKADYIKSLLKVGFDVVDVGSFVSPRAVPQMADSEEIVSSLDLKASTSKIMVIVGNMKGAEKAAIFKEVDIVGFPYSTSFTFLHRNINASPEKAWSDLMEINSLVKSSGKSMRVYLSMAFGNPYGDPWSEDQVINEVEKLQQAGIDDIAFSDITGEGTSESIGHLCLKLIDNFRELKLGVHLHSSPTDWEPKVHAAWQAGFRYFEGALGGFGGCPMSGYELLGNLDTTKLIEWCDKQNIITGLNPDWLKTSIGAVSRIF
jgi:hydroxymethylglutaryl-CoA lyase